MKKILLLLSFIISISLAKEDYSEMSTQELIAIMGYTKAADKKIFFEELEKRKTLMNKNEKIAYEKNLKKLENN